MRVRRHPVCTEERAARSSRDFAASCGGVCRHLAAGVNRAGSFFLHGWAVPSKARVLGAKVMGLYREVACFPITRLALLALGVLTSVARAAPPNDECVDATVITASPFTDTED